LEKRHKLTAKEYPVYIQCDLTGRILFASNNCICLLGANTSELAGQNISSFLGQGIKKQLGKELDAKMTWSNPTGITKDVNVSLLVPSIDTNEVEIYLTPLYYKERESIQLNKKDFEGFIHDLRSPLNTLYQLVHLSEFEDSKEGLLLNLEKIKTITLQLSEIVHDLEGLVSEGSIMTRIIIPEKDIFPILRLIFQSDMDARKIELKLKSSLKSGFNTVYSKVLRILINLIQNAIHYSGAKTVEVNFKTDSKKNIKIEVKDDGKGIYAEDFSSLTKPYVRKDESNQNPEGKGLGLYIVQRLAEVLGGKIEMPQVKSGTKIVITLPGFISQGLEEKLDTKARSGWKSLKGKEIYVLDDDNLNLTFVSNILTKQGIIVNSFRTGKDLLESLHTHVPDLIILDIILSDKDGVIVASEIIEQLGNKTPLLLALSGKVTSFNSLSYKCSGFDEVMAKPVIPQDLLEIINTMFLDTGENNQRLLNEIQNLPAFDESVLRKIDEFTKEDIREELFESFQSEVEETMKLWISNETYLKKKEIFRTLHTWKSSAATLGFVKMEFYSKYLENKFLKSEIKISDINKLLQIISEIKKIINIKR